MVNVQATSPDPTVAAMEMDDKRVSKMVLESAQMICTIKGDPRYRPIHQNNPTTHWCADNFDWLVEWHHNLAAENYYRTGKAHKSFIDVGQRYTFKRQRRTVFRNGARSSRTFPDSSEIDFTNIGNIHRAYRYYLRARFLFDSRAPVWTRRQPPWWLDERNATGKPMIHGYDVHVHNTSPRQYKCVVTDTTRKRYKL